MHSEVHVIKEGKLSENNLSNNNNNNYDNLCSVGNKEINKRDNEKKEVRNEGKRGKGEMKKKYGRGRKRKKKKKYEGKEGRLEIGKEKNEKKGR